MDFEPLTNIYFCRTGIDDNNKVFFKDQEQMKNFMLDSRHLINVTKANSFQRADGFYTIRVDHSEIPYYALLRADTVFYLNEETLSAFYIVGNVLSVDWKNPDCSYVHFKMDHFMTFHTSVDWQKTSAYIEREHVKEDWTSSGNPAFSNIGPTEDFHVMADTPIWHKEETFSPTMVLIQSPYNQDGKAEFAGTIKGGMYSSLQVKAVESSEANDYFKTIANLPEASINNIVSVEAFPSEWLQFLAEGTESNSGQTMVAPYDAVHIAAKSNPAVPKYNNAKCWSSPYTIIRIMSSEGESLDFNPQWFGGDTSSYIPLYKVTSCGGMFGGCAFTLKHQNEGIFDWKYWANFCVMLHTLPKCPWTADQYTDWAKVNMGPLVVHGAVSVARGVTGTIGALNGIAESAVVDWAFDGNSGMATGLDVRTPGMQTGIGGMVNAIGGTANTLANIAATIGQAKSTGAAVQGGGGGNLFDIGQGAWGFKTIYYQAQPYLMNSIDQYFDRFGYRVNRLKRIEIESRPIWNFIKTHECHVAMKPNAGVPYVSQLAINAMFNKGVTMWNPKQVLAGRPIGDFSNPEQNKAPNGGYKETWG